MGDFYDKTDYLTETKGLLKDRINSLGGSITSGTTFRDYLVWLDSLYEALDEKTITGLPDSLEGKCEQNTTPSKNLYNPSFRNSNNSIRVNAGTATESNGTYTLVATGSDLFIWNVLTSTNTDYDSDCGPLISFDSNTFSVSVSNSSFAKNFITFYDDNKKSIGYKFIQQSTFTFTKGESSVSSNAKYFSLRIGNGSATNGTTYTFTIQVEKGQPTSYEPYIPNSPSPDYPQPINITTGRQVVSVAGKNLFSGVFRQGTNSNLTTANRVYCDSNYYIEQGKTYTFSTNMDTSVYRFAINISATPFPSSTLTYDSGWKRQASFTFTASVSGYLGVPISRVNNANFTPSEIEDIEWQLELGNTPSSYEEYKGNDYEINLGKNLLPNNAESQTINGITYTINEDKSIKINGTARGRADLWLYGSITDTGNYVFIPKGNYTMNTANLNDGTMFISFREKTAGVRYMTRQNNGLLTLLSQQDCYFYGIMLAVESGRTINNLTFYPQLEKGSQPTSYSPYKTPIYLGKIGTYQDYIIKTSGKNLFDKDNMTINYYLDSTGTPVSSTFWDISNYIEVKPNTKYTYQGLYTIGSNAVQCVYYNANKEIISVFKQATGTNTITTPNNCYYIRFPINKYTTNDKDTFMINEGDTALPYEPYGEGQWYIHKEIGRVVLNGSENWTTRNGGTSYAYMLQDVFDKYRTTGLCNYFRFIEGGASGSQTTECIASANTNGTASIFTNNSSLNTLANFKTWLSTHNVEVYYVLNTPTNTLIEDEELINQLNEIEIFTVISEDFYN